jgi:hypothetical protein
MSKKMRVNKPKGLSVKQQRRQDNAVMKETGFKIPKNLSPKAKAKAVLAQPIVGGPQSSKSSGGAGNWRNEPRDPKTGRWVKR